MSNDSEASSFVRDWAERQMRWFNAAREEACARAIQSGTHGVRITRNADGSADFEVTREVPFMEIHEYPHGRSEATA